MAEEKKSSPLSMDIKDLKNLGGKKKNQGNITDKVTMNFAHYESSVNLKKLIPTVLLIIAAIVLFFRFGITDQIQKKTNAYSELSVKQATLAAYSAKLSDYNELAQQYGRYSYGWMNDSETGMVDRLEVLKLIENRVMSEATIENYAVNGNVLTINMHGITLEEASAMVRDLESSDIVDSATVYTAASDSEKEAIIFMSVILTKEAEAE